MGALVPTLVHEYTHIIRGHFQSGAPFYIVHRRLARIHVGYEAFVVRELPDK